MRNSSLVECSGTDNVSRLKRVTEAMEFPLVYERGLVGERSVGREARSQELVERTEVRMPE